MPPLKATLDALADEHGVPAILYHIVAVTGWDAKWGPPADYDETCAAVQHLVTAAELLDRLEAKQKARAKKEPANE